MPKRPCAIALTPDESTILCGDKFGDVYALPIWGKPFHLEDSAAKTENESMGDISMKHSTQFVPSASVKTVHTRKNQRALKHQQNAKNKRSSPKALHFDHQLLLGHVSLLTDLVCVPVETGIRGPNNKQPYYIITADRDEHIRVSRGQPQAHVIEGFCLGHTEFLSRLCIPKWDRRLLMSGGGNNYLLIWEWQSGRKVQQIDLCSAVDDLREEMKLKNLQNPVIDAGAEHQLGNKNEHDKIAVSGIWTLETTWASGQLQRKALVTCEGYVNTVQLAE